MTSRVVRVGVSLEPELLRQLDDWVHQRNSPSRSDAIRALIRKELSDRTLSDPNSDALGVVALLYRHDTPNVLRRLTAAEHRWGSTSAPRRTCISKGMRARRWSCCSAVDARSRRRPRTSEA